MRVTFGPAPQTQLHQQQAWGALRVFNFYRLALSAAFCLLTYRAPAPPPLGSSDHTLFFYTSFAYLGLALFAELLLSLRRPHFDLQLTSHMLMDVVVLTLLMHASGGVTSGLGILMVVSVANGAMITAGRTAGLFAAIATIAVLIEQTYSLLELDQTNFSYPHAGFLGITLFTTAMLAHVLARRARESEALAAQRGVDLANMSQLTEYIIQHMRTGVLVVDRHQRIHLRNAAVNDLFDRSEVDEHYLPHLSAELSQRYEAWYQGQERASSPMRFVGSSHDFIPRFMRIGSDSGTLIFLEDVTTSNFQAQQLKLASLGRLTASIAHEIRNPLGAISHASELLAESPNSDAQDQRLTQIIANQSQRMNAIIENVLQLGRRDRSQPALLDLHTWLEHFVAEYCIGRPHLTARFSVVCDEPLQVMFDPTHLQQILGNLCDNALRHIDIERGLVILRCGHLKNGRGYLEVSDDGPGISSADQGHIFEPFFTNDASGTGLGLYIAREMAECNRSHLTYLSEAAPGASFRLLFPEHKHQVS